MSTTKISGRDFTMNDVIQLLVVTPLGFLHERKAAFSLPPAVKTADCGKGLMLGGFSSTPNWRGYC